MDVFFVICLLLAVTAFLALSETSLIASRRTRLSERKSHGDSGAARALEISSRPDVLVTAIEIGVTLISIVIGAYTDSVIAPDFLHLANVFPGISSINRHVLTLIVVGVITYAVLLMQIIPKRIALNCPEAIASIVSLPMTIWIKCFRPLVSIVSASADASIALIPHPKAQQEPPITDAELLMLVRQGTKAGVFVQSEHDMFEAILHLESLSVSSIMHPRTEMHWLDVNYDLEQILETLNSSDQWEMLVAQDNPDNVLGIVNVKELLVAAARNTAIDLRKFLQDGLFVPETEDALSMLQTFRETGSYVAIILDEFGGVAGAVSIRDVVEEIVGHIHRRMENIQKLNNKENEWEVNGLTPISEFGEAFGYEDLPAPGTAPFNTVAGLLLHELGHLPDEGEQLHWKDLDFRVVKLDGHRVDKIIVSKAA